MGLKFINESNFKKVIENNKHIIKKLDYKKTKIVEILNAHKKIINIDSSFDDIIRIDLSDKAPNNLKNTKYLVESTAKNLSNIIKNYSDEIDFKSSEIDSILFLFKSILDRINLEVFPISIDLIQNKINLNYASDLEEYKIMIMKSIQTSLTKLIDSKDKFFITKKKIKNINMKIDCIDEINKTLLKFYEDYEILFNDYIEISKTIKKLFKKENYLKFEFKIIYE